MNLTVALSSIALVSTSCARDAGWLDAAPAPPLEGLAVRTHEPYRLQDQRGQVVLLSFGYTSCVDVCPTTFAKAKAVFQHLGGSGSDLQFVYVTVDPERDTPEALGNFMARVDPRFDGLYVDRPRLAPILDAYHVTVRKRLPDPTGYRRRDVDPRGFYSIDHTAGFWGIDRRGQLRFQIGPETGDAALSALIQRLLSEAP
jgi:protein SCO1/2